MALTKIDDRGLKTPIDLLDNEKIRLGTGNDLELYHDGSDSYIDDSGTGDLCLRSSTIYLQKYTGENCAKFVADGACELYYDNSNKFQTTSGGANVTGRLTTSGVHIGDGGDNDTSLSIGASNDLRLYHDGSNSYIKDRGTGNLYIATNDFNVTNAAVTESIIKGVENGQVELYYDNSKKLETVTGGVYVYGDIVGGVGGTGNISLGDSSKFIAGSGNDLQIYHDGTHSRIVDNGANATSIQTNLLRIHDNSGNFEYMAEFNANGGVELYHDNTKKFETTANGATVSGNNSISMDASANGQLQVVGDGYTGAIALNSSAMHVYHNSGVRDLVFGLNETEKVRILAGGGMTFNGDTATANALDDYEMGTWTPTFQYWDGSAYQTVTFDDALNYTTGQYIKVGNLVHIWYYTGGFSISDSLNNTVSRIVGLPYDFKNASPYYGGVFHFTHTNCFKDDTNTSFDCHGAYGQYNSNVFYPSMGNSSAQARWNSAANRYLMLGGTYQSNT